MMMKCGMSPTLSRSLRLEVTAEDLCEKQIGEQYHEETGLPKIRGDDCLEINGVITMHATVFQGVDKPFEIDCFLVSALADALPLPNTPGAIPGSSYAFNQITRAGRDRLCMTHRKPVFPYIRCRETMHKSKSRRDLRGFGFGLLALGFLRGGSLIVALVYPGLRQRLRSDWLHNFASRTLPLPSLI